MKKQVNIWIDEEIHAELVKQCGHMQMESGRIVKVSTIAAEIVTKHMSNGNSSSSIDTPVDDEQADEQHEQYPDKPAPSDPTAFNFDDLNLD